MLTLFEVLLPFIEDYKGWAYTLRIHGRDLVCV